MQHAGGNSVGASHRDHLRSPLNDPSFTATATSIRLKWRRDSAKRDAKQVATTVNAKLSILHVRGTMSFRSDQSCARFLRVDVRDD